MCDVAKVLRVLIHRIVPSHTFAIVLARICLALSTGLKKKMRGLWSRDASAESAYIS